MSHMQLSCNSDSISGVRVDSTPRKCARSFGEKIPVDATSKSGHFFDSTSPLMPATSARRSEEGQKTGTSSPSPPRSDGLRVEGVTDASGRSVAAASTPWSPTRRRCVGCGVDAVGFVWGLVVCVRCGERINAVAPRGTCLGLGYVIAVCAFVQGLRERPSVPQRRAS